MISSSELLFTLGDLKRLYKKHRRLLVKVGLLSALAIFLFLSIKEPRFRATATFRQAQSGDENVGKLRNLLNVVMLSEQERGAASLMLSHRLGRVVIEKLGLQAAVRERGFAAQKIFNFWRNLCDETGFSRKDGAGFQFREVFFEGEKPLQVFLHFKTEDQFEILNAKREPLAEGRVGEPVRTGSFSFSLVQVPENLSLKKLYPLSLSPWPGCVRHHLRFLQVKPQKPDKNILRLSYSHPNRHLAALFLNEMMGAYQTYLKQENEELSDAQLAYLEKRQQELSGKLDRVLQEQVTYLKENLGETGFIGLKEEVETLAIPKEAYNTRLFDLEMEQRRLEKGGRDLSDEEDLLTPKKHHVKSAPSHESTQNYQNRLANLKLEESKVELPRAASLTQREELEGITLATAQSLYGSYQKELDETQKNIRQLIYFEKQIFMPTFELSSLGGVLRDSVGQSMVQKAAEISLKLRDEKNHSLKEMARLQEALNTEKTFLSHHMKQMEELEKVRKKLVEEKIRSLQTICLDLIKKEKKLIEEKLQELTVKMEDLPEKWRRESHLQFTKELNMGIIEGISKVVESKNLTHNLFHVDSKPIDKAIPPLLPIAPLLLLFSVGGGGLASLLFFLFFLGQGLVRGFPLSFDTLHFYGFKGAGLFSRLCHAPLNEIGSSDLHTLREIQQRISRHKKKTPCVALVGGDRPDYSLNLAELFALQNKRILLIHSAFNKTVTPDEASGLWHYLEGRVAEIHPQKRRGFDFISTGGTSRHAPELLSRENFAKLLEKFKPHYDLILIYTTALPALADAHVFFKYADAIIVTGAEEKPSDLLPYRQWQAEEETRDFAIVCMENA